MHIAIGICTAGRPRMLEDCLRSLAPQRVPPETRVTLVVVDNNRTPEAEPIVEAGRPGMPLAVRYVHEPRRGIAQARNRHLLTALELEADWVAFIDDDETADTDWLAELWAAAQRYGVDVIQGLTVRQYPAKMPLFTLPIQYGARAEGVEREDIGAGNVLFRAWIIRPDGGALRFDERFALSKGEDMDFFLRAGELGARMYHTNRAVARETVPAARLTLRSQLRHYAAETASMSVIGRMHNLPSPGTPATVRRVASRLVMGSLFLLASPIAVLGGPEEFAKMIVRGSRRIAWSIGTIRGMTGRLARPYDRIEGR